MSQKFIKNFFLLSGLLLLLCAFAVILFDPFFQYPILLTKPKGSNFSNSFSF